MMDIAPYLDAQYVEAGREWPRLDCYGIVLLVRRDLGLPEWPEWGGVTKQDDGLHNVGTAFVRDLERCDPEPGAVACCYASGLLAHVAVVVDAGTLHALEITKKHGVTCLPLNRFERRFVRVEYYR